MTRTRSVSARTAAFAVVMTTAVCAGAQTAVDSFDPGANFKVTTLAMQSDGRIVVGGSFSTLGGGGTGTAVRGNIGRLNGDGTIDVGFFPGADNEVDSIVLQPDGRLLVGGYFTLLGGGGGAGNPGVNPRSRIGRLNADGTIDGTFNPGANGAVHVITLRRTGRFSSAARSRRSPAPHATRSVASTPTARSTRRSIPARPDRSGT